MDFSNKRLVSFGDSYTFGQNCTLDSDFRTMMKNKPNSKSIAQTQAEWKNLSNMGSYTTHLVRKMNFKNSINLGAPGASNKTIYDIMYNYCKLNDTKNDFFVISLTSADREHLYSKKIDTGNYAPTTLNLSSFEAVKRSKQFNVELHRDLSLNAAKELMLHMNNDYTVLSKFIQTLDSILTLLKEYNIPYIIFDCINTFSSDNILKSLDPDKNIETSFFDLIFSQTSTDFNYKSDIRIKEYYSDIVNEKIPTYLNQHTMQKYIRYFPGTEMEIPENYKTTSLVNVNRFVTLYGQLYLNNMDKVLSPVPGDAHWSVIGHKFAADILSEWILKHYG